MQRQTCNRSVAQPACSTVIRAVRTGPGSQFLNGEECNGFESRVAYLPFCHPVDRLRRYHGIALSRLTTRTAAIEPSAANFPNVPKKPFSGLDVLSG